MRRLAWLMVLLLPGAAGDILIEDPDGDGAVEVWADAAGAPVTTPTGGTVDLVSLAVRQEGPELVVEVAQAAPLRQAQPELIYVHASVSREEFTIEMFLFRPFDDGRFPATLLKGESRYGTWGYADEERRVWGVRLLLADFIKVDLPLFDGDALSVQGVEASLTETESQGTLAFHIRHVDRVPDALDAQETLELALDDRSVGGLALRSLLPFRSSNGAATIFVYDLALSNTGGDAGVVFDAKEVPEGWKVLVPPPQELSGTENATVLVALPSGHVHGTAQSFLLRMSAGEDRYAETRLGVFFPAIPEPSGHHPRVNVLFNDEEDPIPPEGMDALWGNWGSISLTAAEVEASGEPVVAWQNGADWQWYASTEPMTLGVDVDIEREGRFVGEVVSPLGMKGVQIRIHVGYGNSDDQSGIIGAATVDVGDLPREERFAIDVPLIPDSSGDFVPSGRDGGSLYAWIDLSGTQDLAPRDDTNHPHLVPGATMLLPLLEYHDPVEQRFSRGDSLRLTGDTSRRIVPDGTAIFNVTVHNDADASHDVLVQTISTVTAPRILGDASFRLAAGQSRIVHVALDAPAAGQADAVVLVTSQKDPEQRQAMLVRAIVDALGGDDAAAEAGLAQESDKRSPGVAWLPLGAALAMLAFTRRR